ncbi:MAG: hypothetical protein K8W52_42305 [Deltaproteobacteria bacterium]|nr:hypothetical protein [Deltaproteobacteria bacterium]
MSFLSSALDVGLSSFGVADTLGQVAKDSPFKTVADGAEVAGTVLDMTENGVNWDNGTALAGHGAQFGLDLLEENGNVGFLESLIPGLGPMIGGALSTVGGIGGMVESADQIDQGYLANDAGGRNEFWGSAGNATLGSMHAALGLTESLAIAADAGEAVSGIGLPLELLSLPATGVALGLDESLAGAEAITKGVGTATGLVGTGLNYAQGLEGKDAHDWYFGLGDVVGLAEHAAFDGVRAAGRGAYDCFSHYAE